MRSAQSKIVWDGIVTSVHPDDATSNNTILSIIDNENTKLSRARLLRFYASASPSKELRDASNAATTLLNNGEAKLYSRTDVFLRVVALHRKLHTNGCAIFDPVTKQAFEDGNKGIQELVRRCTSNLDEDSSGLWLPLEELEGEPEDLVAAHKRGGWEYEGKVWLKTKPLHPNKILVLTKSEATRKKVYYAIRNRLPEDAPNYLAFKAADKMVQTPETVTSLLAEIRQRTCPTSLSTLPILRPLVMNYSKPVGTKPTLLSLLDVRRLFHELGHLHHSLCTKNKRASLAYVDRDFVEAPGILFEQFSWKQAYIKDLSRCYSYLSPEYNSAWL
ncbi:peptidase family M3-domain-containing protein [Lasiosphaeria hispida]|uniref:Peptidase family M3-domain-containing protein n=1 Tax=Lasiosphaeria hispida TaxID=260671 RepID=A0AAJ0HUM5_9PEZI|nr:peptidase family M3-domain-containing protein [Lasiosphaeria hispida]